MGFAEEKFQKFIANVGDIAKADPKMEEKEIVKVQDVLKSPQGFSAILEFKRS
jgi:hypothetical protein